MSKLSILKAEGRHLFLLKTNLVVFFFLSFFHGKSAIIAFANNKGSGEPEATLQPLYNTVRYNTVLDITRFKDG